MLVVGAEVTVPWVSATGVPSVTVPCVGVGLVGFNGAAAAR